MQRGMKGIIPKEIRFCRRLPLNGLREFGEYLVEGGGGGEFEHDRLGDQLPE